MILRLAAACTRRRRLTGEDVWFWRFRSLVSTDEYIIEVEGDGKSVPFWIGDHLLEKASTKLGYDFFVDVRGFADLDKYDMTKVYSGGPSRDPFGGDALHLLNKYRTAQCTGRTSQSKEFFPFGQQSAMHQKDRFHLCFRWVLQSLMEPE